jgi:PAS domain-containing protein
MLLMNWLGKRWNSRILAGRGETAQPFVHIDHVVRFFLTLLDRSEILPRFDTYTVASDEIYSHRELFDIATRLIYGAPVEPILLPRPIATLGVVVRDALGRLIGRRPFERLWMMKYVDQQISADTSYSKGMIPVAPKERLTLTRRFPYMLENMISNPVEWKRRNIAILERKSTPPNLIIAGMLRAPSRHADLPHYQALGRDELWQSTELIYDLLVSCVRRRDRMPLLSYAHHLAVMRRQQEFPCQEVKTGLLLAGDTLIDELRTWPELQDKEQALVDLLRLTLEMVVDEVEVAYETKATTELANSGIEQPQTDEWPVMKKRHFLQSVIDSIDDSIVIIDLGYRVRLMNRHARELHVEPEAGSEVLHCFQMAHNREDPCSGKDHPCPLEEVLRTGEAARVTHTHSDRHGHEFQVAILASPLFNEDNDIVGIIESTYRLST